jgi:hypothetical protein
MRLLLGLAVVAAAAAVLTAGAGSGAQGGFAFGRFGGNIRPYTVTISAAGLVRLSGPIVSGRKHLSATQLAALRHVAASVRFTAMPGSTNCSGTNPDVASTFIRVGARTVRVHGLCVAAYNRFWLTLTRAVELSGMA